MLSDQNANVVDSGRSCPTCKVSHLLCSTCRSVCVCDPCDVPCWGEIDTRGLRWTYGPSDQVKTWGKPQLFTAFSSSRAEALILYDPVGAMTTSFSGILVIRMCVSRD